MPNHFKGKKLELFREMRRLSPENTILLPMESALPTVTSVRIKSILNGGLSTIFETTENFVSSEIVEDNLLYQIKHRKNQASSKILFTGDHIWSPLYGQYFDQVDEYESSNTRDLDTLDNNVQKYLIKTLGNE